MIAQFALLASAAVLVSAQGGPPPPAAAAGCTSKSFVIPSWIVTNFVSEGDKTSFTTFNRASNVASTVSCAGGKCTSSGKVNATVEFKETSAFLSLDETWNCNDRPGGDRFMFWGVGNNTVPLVKDGAKLSSKNPQVLVKASLIAPVSITPGYFKGPTGHDNPGCSSVSKKPTWTISDVAFTDVTGDGINSVEQRSIGFLVVNTATGYDASCMASVTPEDTPRQDVLTLTCAGLEFQSPTIGRYSTSTTATFNVVTGEISVTQTWYCDDEDPGRPFSTTGTGTSKLPLLCSTKPLPGNNTHTFCDIATPYTLSGSVTATTPVAPFSIEDPTPGADGCTISSIFSPKWSFSAFHLSGKTTGSAAATVPTSDTTVGFDVILDTQNRRYQYPMPVTQGKKTEDGWYECELGTDGGNGLPLWPYECRFRYDSGKKELVLDAEWECRDLDARHPILFAGVATTTIKSEIACEADGGLAVCGTQDPSYTWTAEISSVTWTAGKPVEETGGLQGR